MLPHRDAAAGVSMPQFLPSGSLSHRAGSLSNCRPGRVEVFTDPRGVGMKGPSPCSWGARPRVQRSLADLPIHLPRVADASSPCPGESRAGGAMQSRGYSAGKRVYRTGLGSSYQLCSPGQAASPPAEPQFSQLSNGHNSAPLIEWAGTRIMGG